MDQSGYLVVANAAAGSRQGERIDAACRVLRSDAPVQVVHTEDPSALPGALETLEGRVLVIAGGDGSVHAAAHELRATGLLDGVTVGLIPCGTGNDFARALGIPLDPVGAAQAIRRGVTRRLDLLVDDDGGVVVNAAHAGLGAEAGQRSHDLKDELGSLAYPLGALIAGIREGGWALTVEVDGSPVVAAAQLLMVGIANGPTIGGGTPLCPVADPADGLLDVIVVAAVVGSGRLAFGAALRDGSHLERDEVHHVRGSRVTIRGEPVRFNVDGEISNPLQSRTYRVDHYAWEVFVPTADAGRRDRDRRSPPP